MENNILEFIHRRFPIDCNWLSGNCFFFAKILETRFSGEIYYDLVEGHFLFYEFDTKEYYDHSGIVNPNEDKLVRWNEYENIDHLHYERILRDCVW